MSEYTPTYILTWNPHKFNWENYEHYVEVNQKSGICMECEWSCRSKKMRRGDRFILLMQGMGDKNGVVAVGTILSSVYELPFSEYWTYFIDIRFDRMWNYKTDKYVRTSVLKAMFPEQCFIPQFSGIRVKQSILPMLWKMIEGEKNV